MGKAAGNTDFSHLRVLVVDDDSEEFGLGGITLLASTTADPAITGLFDEAWFYFRGELSPASVMGAGTRPLFGMAPLVVNAAFAGATAMGLRNIHLFGIDLSLVKDGLHHSKDSIYYLEKYKDKDELFRNNPVHMVAGNFGGEVRTLWLYDLRRRMLGEVQAAHAIELFNCSNGARIPGVQPKVAAAIDLSGVPPDHDRVRRRLRDQLRAFAVGEFLTQVDLDAHIQGCRTFTERFEDFTDGIAAEAGDFHEVERRLVEFLEANHDQCLGVVALTHRSFYSMVRLAAYFGCRIDDEEKRRAYVRFFAGAFAVRCREMAATTRELLIAMKQGTVDHSHDYSALPPDMQQPPA